MFRKNRASNAVPTEIRPAMTASCTSSADTPWSIAEDEAPRRGTTGRLVGGLPLDEPREADDLPRDAGGLPPDEPREADGGVSSSIEDVLTLSRFIVPVLPRKARRLLSPCCLVYHA